MNQNKNSNPRLTPIREAFLRAALNNRIFFRRDPSPHFEAGDVKITEQAGKIMIANGMIENIPTPEGADYEMRLTDLARSVLVRAAKQKEEFLSRHPRAWKSKNSVEA